MSQFMFFADPASALPMEKKTMAHSIIGLRPKMSASAPDSGRMAVLAKAYAEPTQVNLSPPLRSAVMVGSTVETPVRSRALRKMDAIMDIYASQKADPFPFLLLFSC